MATAHILPAQQQSITVEEYLRTSFDPDCDYVDGQVEERNLGEFEHAKLQGWFLRHFWMHEKEWRVLAIQECRLQVSPNRFRIPDVMVLPAGKYSGVIRTTPILCIEVLSPEDRLSRMRERARDYQKMGVQQVWYFDPYERVAYRVEEDGFLKVKEPILTVPDTQISVSVAEVFASLDSNY